MSRFIKCFRKTKEPREQDAHSLKNGKVELNGFQKNPSKNNLSVAKSSVSNSASSNHSETDQPPNWAMEPMMYEPSADSFTSGLKTSHLAKEYSMNHDERGTAFIFNNTHFKNNFEHGAETPTARHGAEKDEQDLKDCFERLGFKVEIYRNLGNEEFQAKLNEISDRDFSRVDCFAMVVMSHGHNHKITLSNGVEYPVNLIWEKFMPSECRSLAAKPKLFFIQACRGKKYDHGHHIRPPGVASSKDETDTGVFSYAIPNAADILVSYSSPPVEVDERSYWEHFKNMFCCTGFYSWRDTKEGSWFIQAICKVFNKYAFEVDILHLMTLVAQEVALHKTSVTDEPSTSGKRQVPSMTSTLIRQLKFTPKVHLTRGPCPVPMVVRTGPSRVPSNRSTNSTHPTFPPTRLRAPPPLVHVSANGIVTTTAQVDIEETEQVQAAEGELTSEVLINGKVPLPKVSGAATTSIVSTSQSNGNTGTISNVLTSATDDFLDQEFV